MSEHTPEDPASPQITNQLPLHSLLVHLEDVWEKEQQSRKKESDYQFLYWQ